MYNIYIYSMIYIYILYIFNTYNVIYNVYIGVGDALSVELETNRTILEEMYREWKWYI